MPDRRLPATGRLKKRSEFLATRRGERRRGPYFLLEVLDRGMADEPARVGYTVSKRQGNAVERNRIRRRLREAMRLGAGFELKPGHDYVVVARRDALHAPFEKLARSLAKRIGRNDERIGWNDDRNR